ncbi:ATP-binding protein [Barnesiella sp. WM24]|uniref:AlbA family DNA-binding domain-containing protein n=1 Tax=Barnesiella sp. WM24 TaxID=2558278 RepID=UPI0010716DEC|nr:ATP-binding protein [Barnesiella sp. WM24]TFU94805.1 ATP-binding protein [Barnesiella sp. WM24]
MKDLQPIKGKYYIHSLIMEGEHEHQDFKFAITDAAKIAHSISAFANNDGGRLLVGVKDNGNIAGVRSDEDIYVIEQAAQMFCNPPQEVKITAFRVDNGAVVLRADILKADRRPVYSKSVDGTWRAYYRVKDENIVAHPVMVKAWRHVEEAEEGMVFSLSEKETALLDYLDEWGMTTVEDYMTGTHISRAAAEDIVVKLYAVGVIDFVYTSTEFKIVRVS